MFVHVVVRYVRVRGPDTIQHVLLGQFQQRRRRYIEQHHGMRRHDIGPVGVRVQMHTQKRKRVVHVEQRVGTRE